VDHAGGQGQALFPAPRERAGQLIAKPAQVHALNGAGNPGGPVGHGVHAGDEIEVFPHGHVLIERELLGHVAHMGLYQLGLLPHVEAQACAVAVVGAKQPAQHADKCGLARAVGAEKAVYFATIHPHVDVVDHGLAAEYLGQPGHVDDGRGNSGVHGLAPAPAGSRYTSMGRPGCRRGATAGSKDASTMTTSFSRKPWL